MVRYVLQKFHFPLLKENQLLQLLYIPHPDRTFQSYVDILAGMIVAFPEWTCSLGMIRDLPEMSGYESSLRQAVDLADGTFVEQQFKQELRVLHAGQALTARTIEWKDKQLLQQERVKRRLEVKEEEKEAKRQHKERLSQQHQALLESAADVDEEPAPPPARIPKAQALQQAQASLRVALHAPPTVPPARSTPASESQAAASPVLLSSPAASSSGGPADTVAHTSELSTQAAEEEAPDAARARKKTAVPRPKAGAALDPERVARLKERMGVK